MLIVVMGPPCSGKSTWVRQRAKPTDIVIDYDQIAIALSGPRAADHDHSGVVDAVTKAARKAAIHTALRYATRVDVYLIHSNPGRHEIAAYQQRGADVVLLDPGRDVVRERCGRERPPRIYAAIDEWYRDHAAGGWTPRPRSNQTRPGPTSGAADPRGTQAWRRLCAQVYAEEAYCWICQGWVDQALPREDPMSRTVDHVVPVARGGPAIPDRAGVRLAHRRCNSARGDQPERLTQQRLTIPITSI